MAEAGLFTLGVEEEFQIVDPETRELKSHIQQILEDGKMILAENVKAEMHQSVVEMGTDICLDVKDARQQVTKLRTDLAKLAIKNGLKNCGFRNTSILSLERSKNYRASSLQSYC